MKCEQCNDTGFEVVNGGVRECECRRVRVLEQKLSRTGLPERYWSASFETFNPNVSPSVGNALMMARRYVDDYPSNRGLGILFTGPVGVGKTHLSICILRELTLRYGVGARFTDFRDLLKKMQSTFGGARSVTEEEILCPILEADVVVLDELGAVRVTDWTFDVVEHVINTRYNKAKSTILTTNLQNRPAGWTQARSATAGSYADRAAQGPTVDTLGDRIGTRMHSRLQEMCRIVEVHGDDYRARGQWRS